MLPPRAMVASSTGMLVRTLVLPGSVMSIQGHIDACVMGHHLQPCWGSRDVTLPSLCWSEWPALPPVAMELTLLYQPGYDACYTEGGADTWNMGWHLKPNWNSRVQSNYRLSPPSKYWAILQSQNLDIQILYVFKFREKNPSNSFGPWRHVLSSVYVHSNA